jgi:hypothetical protein
LFFKIADFIGGDDELVFVAEGGVGSEEIDEVGFIGL